MKIQIIFFAVFCSLSLGSTEVPSEDTALNKTDEVCTCCPVFPSLGKNQDSKVDQIRKELKVNLEKLFDVYDVESDKVAEKFDPLYEERETLYVKLREVRKVNKDKENELKLDEKLKKNRSLRKEFKELDSSLKSSTTARFEAKRDYQFLRDECRESHAEHTETECREGIAAKLETINKANANISSTLDNMKKIHEEIVQQESEIVTAENTLWEFVFENRKNILPTIKKVDEITSSIDILDSELEEMYEKYLSDYEELNKKGRAELLNASPKSSYKWVQFIPSSSKTPKNVVEVGTFYVARDNTYDEVSYGRYSIHHNFGNFINDEYYFDEEYTSYNFDVLVGQNLVWCEDDEISTEEFDEELPICRAEHNGVLVPGRLYSSGLCEIGYNFEPFYYYTSNGAEVLRQGVC